MTSYPLQVLETPEEMRAVEQVQRTVWPGNEIEIVPAHLLLSLAHNGGTVIGAFDHSAGTNNAQLIGFVYGFPGIAETDQGFKWKFCSHQMGVLPDYHNKGLGFALKRAQWQLARQQGYGLITWTYNPLLSHNAYLNIAKLGVVCNVYFRDYYGELRDGLNVGFPTDRLQAAWWVKTSRVERRMNDQHLEPLTLSHYEPSGAEIIAFGNKPSKTPPRLVLLEIPYDYQSLKSDHTDTAVAWRLHIRSSLETLFDKGYLITDFIVDSEKSRRCFYVLSYGESTI
ncbi:MAG: hypothetical protein IMY76_05700 [Chloroflexi bacterium]|nr:hypothetical protein [Chloroflexota bacterium]